MERRKRARVRCNIPCDVVIAGKSVAGTVRNVSEGGLGVDAPLAAAAEGDSLEVTLKPAGRPPIDLVALVWHVRAVRPGRSPERQARLGLVVSDAGDDWVRFIAPLVPAASTAEARPEGDASAAVAPRLRFAVQVAQAGSPRTRRVVVAATSADEARERALAETGPGWSVVDVRPARD
jgi:hypothetical protein